MPSERADIRDNAPLMRVKAGKTQELVGCHPGLQPPTRVPKRLNRPSHESAEWRGVGEREPSRDVHTYTQKSFPPPPVWKARAKEPQEPHALGAGHIPLRCQKGSRTVIWRGKAWSMSSYLLEFPDPSGTSPTNSYCPEMSSMPSC